MTAQATPAAWARREARPNWSLPFGLLVAESLILSLLADYPTSGPALGVVAAGRTLFPSAIGAGAAGWLIARGARTAPSPDAGPWPPAWRPRGALLAHLVSFAVTAWLARSLMGPGVAPITAGAFLAWAGCAAVTAVLALATAAPLAWTVRLAARHLRVPLLAMAVGVLAWRAAAWSEALWGVLGASTLRSAGALLHVARSDVVIVPAESVLGAGDFEVMIAPECSGVDGLGLILVFQALWFSLARSRVRFGRVALLLPVVLVAWFGANVLRIVTLILLGASGRSDLALGAFHSRLGWLLFVAIALAVVAVGEHVRWFRRAGAVAEAEGAGVPARTVAYVGPLMAALATALVTGMWAHGALDLAYGLRIGAAVLVLVIARRGLPRPALSLSLVPLLVGGAVAAAWIAWPQGDGSGLREPLAALSPAAWAAWVVVRVAGACVVIPVVEELAFRGFLLPWLVRPDVETASPREWTWTAVLLSSAAFGVLHERFLLGALAGGAFAFVRLRRGRLGDAVLAHAVANAAIAVAVLAGGRWDLWS